MITIHFDQRSFDRDFRYAKDLTVSLALGMCGWSYMNHATIVRQFLCPSTICSLFAWATILRNHR
ncbi:hypothetical protein J3E68DRAFT_411511 [Trichoderma sp. SZMC 28012]